MPIINYPIISAHRNNVPIILHIGTLSALSFFIRAMRPRSRGTIEDIMDTKVVDIDGKECTFESLVVGSYFDLPGYPGHWMKTSKDTMYNLVTKTIFKKVVDKNNTLT